ncbi:MAG: hypothetical protein ACLQU2_01250 [Candidatus Binataceae bacterium]
MRLYHRTAGATALRIRNSEFADSRVRIGIKTHVGVWFSDQLLKRPGCNCTMGVEFDAAAMELFAPFEIATRDDRYRLWIIPARLVNERMKFITIEMDLPPLDKAPPPELPRHDSSRAEMEFDLWR